MLTFRQLHASDPEDRTRLQSVLETAPAYSRLVRGRPALTTDAAEVFNERPPGLSESDKLVGGFWLGNQMIGCLDLCRGYPRVDIAYIGLLLFGETYQGRGFGRLALDQVCRMARAWGCSDLRLAIIETNTPALGLWRHLGFTDIDRKAVSGYLGEAIVMQRPISAPDGPRPVGDR
jgi:ribosomal protein S18 acetylase RimI-like enzyme